MSDIVIGRTLERLRINVIRASQQAFALAWKDAAGNPSDISTYTFTIVLDTTPATVWTAAKSGSNTTWTLSATESNMAPGFYAGRLIFDNGSPAVAYQVSVEVQ